MKIPFSIPGLDSYRGRYLYLTAFVLMLLFVFAYSSWNEITQASQLTRKNIIDRRENSNLLTEIVNQFQTIRGQIYKFSLIPESFEEEMISQSTIRLLELTEQVDIAFFDDIEDEILNNFIIQLPIQIHNKTIELINIRTKSEAWIPATRVMTEKLSPLNEQIITALNNILSDLGAQNHDSANELNKFLELKNSWLSIISEFRLLTSNRLGIFAQTDNGLASRQVNLEILIQQLNTKLNALEPIIDSDKFSFIRNFYFPEIKANIHSWIKEHKQAIALLMQQYWRQDILVLQQFEALLDQYNQSISLLQNELEIQSSQDIENLNTINRSLSIYFILLCLLGLTLAVIGYLFFERNILRPIAETTRALLLQSQGLSQELDIISKTRESHDLVNAFNHMSEQIKQREQRLDFIAHHDALTNLPNRLLFNERLEHAIKLTERSNKQVALMLLDLDRFKLINDTLGHLFGDKLLQETATRIKNCMREEDTIARLGGDEFAIILENISDISEVEIFANKIINLFEKPFLIDNHKIHSSTSIGIALAPFNTTDPTALIRYTDISMYQSKSMGRNCYTWFHDDMEYTEESILNFEIQLREAITDQQFELHYQPLINISDPEFIACEALLRWHHPEHGLLCPDEFMPILDNSDLMFDLTCWVIRECQKFQLLVEKKHTLIPTVSINLHSIVFQQKHYRNRIERILLKEIDNPDKYILEVTENSLLTDMNNTSITLGKLHDRGFQIALDDFGTGQSSLSHLRFFPIDIIKIDQEFIQDLHTNINNANLTKAIISLGHDLNIQVVAEGVELQDQYEFLVDKGCQLIQGHLFSKPMRPDDYLNYINNQITKMKT